MMFKNIDDLLIQADVALASGRLLEAQESYQYILKMEPFSPKALLGLLSIARMNGQADSVIRDLVIGALDLTAAGRKYEAKQCLEAIHCFVKEIPSGELEAVVVLLIAGGISFAGTQNFEEAEWCCQPVFDRAKDLPLDVMISILNELESSIKDDAGLDIRIKCLRELFGAQPDNSDLLFRFVNALHGRCWQLSATDPEKAICFAEEAYSLYGSNDEVLRQLLTLRSQHGPPERRQMLLDELIARFDRITPAPSPRRGLRELDGDKMTAEEIADALVSEGAVLIRNMVTAEQREYLLAEMQNKPWKQSEQSMIRALRPVILDGMAKVFGRRPNGLTQASGIRTASLEDDQTYLFYHQDVVPLYTMGINLWAALDPIDGTRPGLEVLVRRQHKAFPVGSGNIRNSTDYEISQDLVREVFEPDDFVRPHMNIGDGMMFLFSTVHSSYIVSGMTKSRRNMEFRFT